MESLYKTLCDWEVVWSAENACSSKIEDSLQKLISKLRKYVSFTSTPSKVSYSWSNNNKEYMSN